MISEFNRKFFNSEERITYIGTGEIGGKAHGLVFINDVLKKEIVKDDFPQIEVNIPRLTVIRTNIFDAFMNQNDLFEIAYSDLPDDRIAHAFQKASLPFAILGDLRALITEVKSPLAVRSSSLLEDAKHEPFAGVYASKMTPNNQYDIESRFNKMVEAIKFVYASTFFRAAKDYIQATKHRIEDEKMAVIIQKVVGQRHDNQYYPELSGVARSFNFYPSGPAKPEEGVVNLALGLGKTIVDGGASWAFSPAYPKISPPFGSIPEMLKETQTEYWCVNMGKPSQYNPVKETEYMLKNNIEEAESHGTLRYLASTYDYQADRLDIGIGGEGPRLLNFARLLVMNDIPLNSLMKKIMTVCEKALEDPVEIEFAMTFHKDKPHQFGFLQVRPMVVSNEEVIIKTDKLTREEIFVASKSVLGNGTNGNIHDIIYVIPEKFDGTSTRDIAIELESINKRLVSEASPYLLIGFGRWGSSDPFMNIPVTWGQISGVLAIVEAAKENVNVDMSQGSHFFHNLTSFGVSYFSVAKNEEYPVDWEWLARQELVEERKYVRHVKLTKPIIIKVDGKSGRGVILKD
ncbi:MAG: PEP/pyruvate-binding domain-containing protein [Bacteroidota bacterium]